MTAAAKQARTECMKLKIIAALAVAMSYELLGKALSDPA
jgi:hypothetical protein